jgi:lysozyme family protein
MNVNDKFAIALKRTLDFEGGYSNDPADRGGETKWGITQKTWAGYGSDTEWRHMTLNDAQNLYLNVYWRGACLSVLDSGAVPQRLLNEIFDAVVNHGIAGGIRCLQRAYNDINGDGDDLVVDGRIGNKTITAVASFCNRNGSYADALLAALRFERAGLYFNLCNDPTQKKFLRGWLRRLI